MSIIQCRRCGKLLQYEKIKELPFFPFCSKRCKLIDLGQWLDEEHRVPGDAPPAPEDGQTGKDE